MYQLRLDYVLVHRSLKRHVRHLRLIRGMGSDHGAQIFEVDRSLIFSVPEPIPSPSDEPFASVLHGNVDAITALTSTLILNDCDRNTLSTGDLLFGDETRIEVPPLTLEQESVTSLEPAVSPILADHVRIADLCALDPFGDGNVPFSEFCAHVEDVRRAETSSYADASSSELRRNNGAEYMQTRPGPALLIAVDVRVHGKQWNSPLSSTLHGIADSGCSSSTASLQELEAVFGREHIRSKLYTEGWLPSFNVANNERVAAVGQLRMEFFIGNVKFCHVFFVLPHLSYPFILGNNFLRQTGAVLNYRKGLLTLNANDNGCERQAIVPFGVEHVNSACPYSTPRTEYPLLAAHYFSVPPLSVRYVHIGRSSFRRQSLWACQPPPCCPRPVCSVWRDRPETH